MITKKTSDYIDILHEKYPEIDKKTLNNFINYGMRSISGLLHSGSEVRLQANKRSIMIGVPMPIENHNIKVRKLKIKKLRRLYKKRGIKYSGIRYISLTDSRYEEFLDTGEIKNLCAYKIKEEAEEQVGRHIIEIESTEDKGWRQIIKYYNVNDKKNTEYI